MWSFDQPSGVVYKGSLSRQPDYPSNTKSHINSDIPMNLNSCSLMATPRDKRRQPSYLDSQSGSLLSLEADLRSPGSDLSGPTGCEIPNSVAREYNILNRCYARTLSETDSSTAAKGPIVEENEDYTKETVSSAMLTEAERILESAKQRLTVCQPYPRFPPARYCSLY